MLKKKRVFADLKLSLENLVDELVVMVDKRLEVLSPLDGKVELFKEVLHHIVQKVEHQRIVQVDHLVGEVKASIDEGVAEDLLVFAQLQVN